MRRCFSLTSTSRNDGGQASLTFVEDRSDVMRRAMPRLAVGNAVWCLVIAGLIWATYHTAPMPKVMTIVGVIWLTSLAIRFDVFALQFGRRIQYEITVDQFHAHRGSRMVASFDLSTVTEWVAASSASTFEYWLGWGFWRSSGLPSALPQYSFKVAVEGRNRPKTVRPPALFRWADRGGLEDVTRELIKRLGPPLNYSIDYSLDE